MKIKTVEEKTEGGILLPSSAQSKPQGGEVVAVGEGKTIGKAKLDISVKVIFIDSMLSNSPVSMLSSLITHSVGVLLV